MFSSRCWSTR